MAVSNFSRGKSGVSNRAMRREMRRRRLVFAIGLLIGIVLISIGVWAFCVGGTFAGACGTLAVLLGAGSILTGAIFASAEERP